MKQRQIKNRGYSQSALDGVVPMDYLLGVAASTLNIRKNNHKKRDLTGENERQSNYLE